MPRRQSRRREPCAKTLPGMPATRGLSRAAQAHLARPAESIRARLRARLPAYMVPALLETLAELPTLPSGKVDRKSLPAPACAAVRSRSAADRSRRRAPPLEQQLVASWEKLFAPTPVSVQDDFFLDLGGHSLLAARMVSELRQTHPLPSNSPCWTSISHPTVEKLGGTQFELRVRCGIRRPKSESATPALRTPNSALPVPFWRHFFCGAAQLISLFFILSFFALQWLTPYLTYTMLVEEEYDFLPAVLGAFASLIAVLSGDADASRLWSSGS